MKILISLLLSVTVQASLPLKELKVFDGYKVELFAKVPGARSMAQAPDGRLFVGTMKDTVYVVNNGKVQKFATRLNTPNGVAYRDGKLYVAELNRILVFDAQDPKAKLPVKNFKVLPQHFPSDKWHGWKFIRFGPDGWLYVPVGANCNVCLPGEDYARLYKIDVGGLSKEVVAQGIRNTVGFDWHPGTKELWFTDNGRDYLGEDSPPDELNRMRKVGLHFGFPYCHGGTILDPKFGEGHICKDYEPPALPLRAHVASLGMRFWGPDKILVAEHGSWNRKVPQGYRVNFIHLRKNEIAAQETFVEGFLKGEKAWGRPVDIEILSDTSFLVSDDESGSIYLVKKDQK